MKHLIWGNEEAKCFCAEDWTGEISLKSFEKLLFWRNLERLRWRVVGERPRSSDHRAQIRRV